MPEPKDPITLLIENPNLAFCAMLLQAVTFMAALYPFDASPLKPFSIAILIALNLFFLASFGKWVFTGKRLE